MLPGRPVGVHLEWQIDLVALFEALFLLWNSLRVFRNCRGGHP